MGQCLLKLLKPQDFDTPFRIGFPRRNALLPQCSNSYVANAAILQPAHPALHNPERNEHALPADQDQSNRGEV